MNNTDSEFARFIARIPAWIGFVPNDSITIVLVDDDNHAQGAIGLPMDWKRRPLRSLLKAVDRCGPGGVILVAAAADPMDRIAYVKRWLRKEVRSTVVMRSYEPGSMWVVLETNDSGLLPDYRTTTEAADRAYSGWQIFPGMTDLQATFQRSEPEAELDLFEGTAEELALIMNMVLTGGNVDASLIGSLFEQGLIRRAVFQTIEVNPAQAHHVFASAARSLRGQARVDALVAAAAASAFRCDEILLAWFAIAAAHREILEFEQSGESCVPLDVEMLNALEAAAARGGAMKSVEELWAS